jgi:WD40 repeat protein
MARPTETALFSVRMDHLLKTIVLTLTLVGSVSAFPSLSRRDLHGDLLPPGASARLGTIQLRADCRFLSITPDGERLVGVDGPLLREWQAKDGHLLRSEQVLPSVQCRSSLSEDGRTVVCPGTNPVELRELPSGKKLGLPVPAGKLPVHLAAVSNDREWILLAEVRGVRDPAIRGGFELKENVYQLRLWNTKTSQSRILCDDATGLVWLAFSPDGKKVVSTGGQLSFGSGTQVWHTATGKRLWDVPNYNAEQTHFTPDGKHLIAAPGGGQNEWHIWDADTGKPAKDLHTPTGYVWMFAVSPDGIQLLLPTDTDYVLWDMKTGKEIRCWPGALQRGRVLFSPDGRSAITYDTVFRRWDVATGKNLYADVESLGHVAPVKRIFFSPDSKRVVSVGEDRTARVWDAGSSKLLRTVRIDGSRIEAWAISPDASQLVGVDDKLVLHRWSLAGKRPKVSVDLRETQNHESRLEAREIRVAPNGTLAMLAWPRLPEYRFNRLTFSYWDLATGRNLGWGGDPGNDYRGDYTRLAPDGTWAASAESLYETRTGIRRALPASPFGGAGIPTFSPDGRLVASASAGLRVWEVATARVLADLPRGTGTNDLIALSPNNRHLATVSSEKLVVWDLAAGRAVAEWSFPSNQPNHVPWISGGLVFSPDGRTLATGHADGTVLLWPLPESISEGPWNDAEGVAFLNDLGDELLANSYPAVWQLCTQPVDAVRLLKARFPLAPAALPEEWKKLIAGLDSSRFAEREAATKRLEQLGRAAIGPLRQALKDKPSAEQVKRIETLLSEFDPTNTRPRGDDLRAVRAVAVLEICGTDEAKKLLAQWAERGANPRLADEAAKAVERLKR